MSRIGRIRFAWSPSLAAAALWILCAGTFGYLSWNELVPRQFLAHFVSETMPSSVWHLPWPWLFLVPLTSALVVFFAYLLLASLITRDPAGSRSSRFLALWFVAVAAGFLASAPWAISAIVTEFPPARAAFFLDPAGDWMLRSGYWGVLWGWLPALIGSLRLRGSGSIAAAEPVATEPAGLNAGRSRGTLPVLAAIVVVALCASAVTVGVGSRAARLQAAALSAIDEGHTISNFSAAPCVLEGYPDIAFADENGSELDVSISHGGSFMTEDAGAIPDVVPPGGFAQTRIGWDAMPNDGALVAYAVHAALYPGLPRGSWPITLDIVAGGEVAITAWTLSDAAPAAQ